MVRTAAIAGLAFTFLLGGPVAACAAGGGPVPAQADDIAEALKAAEAAREKVAASERVAAEASRARRLALLEAVKAEGALAEAYLRAGKDAEATASEHRLRKLLGELTAAGGAPEAPRTFGPRPAAPAFGGRRAQPSEKAPVASEGLPPIPNRAGEPEGEAVAQGLRWLAAHQGPSGHWDTDGFTGQCRDGTCPGTGGPMYDPGVTALATLAFLGAGETHKTPAHGGTVEKALKYLKGIQDAEGCFGSRTSSHFTYNHALATLAMAEAYALTQSPLFKESAQSGVDFALRAQNPYLGWRYGVKPQDNDTSVTTWMVMALKSAKTAGLSVDDGAFSGAVAWLDKVTEPEYGRVGYTARGNGPARPQELMDAYPSDRSESLTAAGVFARFLAGQKADHEMIRKGIALIGKTPPVWSDAGGIDFYYWYFGTAACFQVGGDAWRDWNTALGKALLPHQRGEESGCARGSWDPVDPWGQEGGRVYSTSLATLSLEMRHRYAMVFGGK